LGRRPITTTDDTLIHHKTKIILAKREFEHFLDFVYILEPPPGKGRIKFEKWPHIEEVIEALLTQERIVWLKSRQTGASWIIAALFLWQAMYFRGSHLLEFSQGQDECVELLWKSKYVYQQLPKELQVAPKSLDNQQNFEFPTMDSWIKAFPSTQKAGRSYTGTKAVFDEADFHPWLAENLSAVEPVLNDNGGQLILVSTSNPELADSVFKRHYRRAQPFQRALEVAPEH
jgi:hypothetical protein